MFDSYEIRKIQQRFGIKEENSLENEVKEAFKKLFEEDIKIRDRMNKMQMEINSSGEIPKEYLFLAKDEKYNPYISEIIERFNKDYDNYNIADDVNIILERKQ